MIVGIDLGTTNSLVGIWRNGAATLIPNSLGHMLTPSAVAATTARSWWGSRRASGWCDFGPAAAARAGTVGKQKDRETLADGWI
jgi:molecular chaperone DnaK (HSP70)